jgi:hypothetical protein
MHPGRRPFTRRHRTEKAVRIVNLEERLRCLALHHDLLIGSILVIP